MSGAVYKRRIDSIASIASMASMALIASIASIALIASIASITLIEIDSLVFYACCILVWPSPSRIRHCAQTGVDPQPIGAYALLCLNPKLSIKQERAV